MNSFNVFRRKGHSLESLTLLKEEGLKLGLNIDIFKTGDTDISGKTLRWGSVGELPISAEVLNKASGIRLTSDKGKFRRKLAEAGLAPALYTGSDLPKDRFPVLVRPNKHSRGDDFFVCNSAEEIIEARQSLEEGSYTSEIIDKKEEFRVFIFKGRILSVLRKKPKDKTKIFWGCTDEGAFEYIGWGDWNLNLCDVAIKAWKLSTLDLCTFDIIQGKDGKFYVLENNTAPELTPYYAKCIVKALIWEVLDKEVPEVGEISSYHDVIHPAISGN